MSTAAEPILTFAGYILDPRRRLLIAPDGLPVDISPRAFETLHYLASHPNELLTKHRLMKAVWPNSVVEENNLTQQISTLRKVLGEAAGEHRFIVTVSGQGYRFVQEVQEAPEVPHVQSKPSALNSRSAELDSASKTDVPQGRHRDDTPGASDRRGWRTLRAPAAAATTALLILVGAYVLLAGGRSLRAVPTETPSIAVLPFVDLSANHDQGYFAEGLSDELLSALGRIHGLRVIGRTSSFSFKGRNEDVRQIAATLGVRHVLEGSVRRDGDRLRITAQLLDATNGSQLWAQTYDRRLGEIFAIQKQVADSVAGTLQLTLRPARIAVIAGGTHNLEAYDAYLAARAVMNNGGSTQARGAIEQLERAVQLDPDFALAWAALAEAYTFAVDFMPSSELSLTPVERQQRVSRAALRALELAPEAPQTLRSAGMVSMQNRDWEEAERRLRKAVELAGPYDYDANLIYALFLMNVGRVSEAIPYEERAVHAEPLLLRPVAFLAALYEMRGELDKADQLLLASAHLQGDEALRKQGLVMVQMARHVRSGLRRIIDGATCDSLDDRQHALQELHRSYSDTLSRSAHGQMIPVAIFASYLGDPALSLDALRALGSTQNLHTIWRPVLGEVRGQPEFVEYMRGLGLLDYWRASGDWGEFCRETKSGEVTCR
jgi:TolB-like protein/DNA-binding winged helix-turn-helix (wHTH) protein